MLKKTPSQKCKGVFVFYNLSFKLLFYAVAQHGLSHYKWF